MKYKRYVPIFILFAMLLSIFVSAIAITTFSTNLSAENLTFQGENQTLTRYINLTKYSNVTSAAFNISAFLNHSLNGFSFDPSCHNCQGSSSINSRAVDFNGTYFMIGLHDSIFGRDYIEYYTTSGNYANSFINITNLAFTNSQAFGIAHNTTRIWTLYRSGTTIYELYSNGTYSGTNFNSSVITNPSGFTYFNSSFYIINGGSDDNVYRTYLNGTYLGFNFSIDETGNNGADSLYIDGRYIYVSDGTDNLIYLYLMNGSSAGINFTGTSQFSTTIPLTAYNNSIYAGGYPFATTYSAYNNYNWPLNLSVSLGNVPFWNYTTTFAQQNNRTNDMATLINNYKSTCQISNNICPIPLNFSSQSTGILQYSNIVINYDPTPFVNLTSPLNNTFVSTLKELFLNATDEISLTNATLYVWNSSGILINSTLRRNITGTSNTTSFNYSLPYDGTFKWNYLVYNNGSYPNFADSNNTMVADVVNPVITNAFPYNVSGVNRNNFNLSCLYEGSSLNSGFLYGNFSGTYALNRTNLSIIASMNTNFSMNLPEGYYSYSCAVNKTTASTLYFTQYGNYSFYVDTKNPLLSILSPIGNYGSVSVPLSLNASDALSGLSYCYYNVTRGASTEVANTQIFNCNNATIIVSGDANYVVYVSVADLAGNTNQSNQSFAVSTGGGGGGGGGGGPTIINSNSNLSWSMTTDTRTAQYSLKMSADSTRTKDLVFVNSATTLIDLSLSISGNGSQFLSLESTSLQLPVISGVATTVKSTITIPATIPDGTYFATVLATDQASNQQIVTYVIEVGKYNFLSKLGLDKDIAGISVPYWLIGLLSSMIVSLLSYYSLKFANLQSIAFTVAIVAFVPAFIIVTALL